MAEECDLQVEHASPRVTLPNDGYAAMLYNLDSCPEGERRHLIGRLRRSQTTALLAIHGYSLTDDQRAALQQEGILVFGRLQQRVFLELARALKAEPARKSSDPRRPAAEVKDDPRQDGSPKPGHQADRRQPDHWPEGTRLQQLAYRQSRQSANNKAADS